MEIPIYNADNRNCTAATKVAPQRRRQGHVNGADNLLFGSTILDTFTAHCCRLFKRCNGGVCTPEQLNSGYLRLLKMAGKPGCPTRADSLRLSGGAYMHIDTAGSRSVCDKHRSVVPGR